MGQSTPATAALRAGGVSFELWTYEYDPNSDRVGLQAAQSLGEPPSRVLKTLIAQVDNTPVCLVLQSDREASMKRVAAALRARSDQLAPQADRKNGLHSKVRDGSGSGGKGARILTPNEAERLTGLRTLVEITAVPEPYVFVNGGLRGLQVKLAPHELVRASDALTVAIVA